MNKWVCFLIFMAFFCIVMYLLYCQGIVISRSIAALLFVFRPGKSTDTATLDSCTGWVRHVGRFHESQTYEFTLDAQLSKGDVEVFLLDRKKHRLLTLNQKFPNGRIELERKSRYYLCWKFRSATGKCQLRW